MFLLKNQPVSYGQGKQFLIYLSTADNNSELAKLSGRQPSNLSRTLKTMERYGIVELRKKAKAIKPIAKATAFNIQYGMT